MMERLEKEDELKDEETGGEELKLEDKKSRIESRWKNKFI
jgi:hypothetical protein